MKKIAALGNGVLEGDPSLSGANATIDDITNAPAVYELPREHWDPQLQNTASRIEQETGKTVRFVVGKLQVKGGAAKGAISGGQIIVQCDNLKYTADQIADHEAFHDKVNRARVDNHTNIVAELRKKLLETFSQEQLQKKLEQYAEALDGYLDPDMAKDPAACEEVWERILEELLADAYSGINWRGIGATQYTEDVNRYMDELGMGKGQIQENGTRQTNGPPATQERYSADEGYVDKSSSGGYDFTKPFGAQLDDFLNGVFPQRDTFIIGPTPDILERVGLAKLPVTMDRKHVSYALEGTYPGSEERKKDHMMEKEDLENILEKIADPVAIIQDRQTWQKGPSGYSVDVLIDMEINGKKSLIPVNVNQSGYANGKEYDSNKLTTIHGDVDTELRLANALNEHSDENIAVFYINKAKANEFLQPAGHPISRTAAMLDGFVASVTDTGSNVKMRIHSVTESRQFKDWFGDWMKHPESASKVVNADGTPKVVYHGSKELFSVFSYGHIGSGSGNAYLGEGFYFTDSKALAEGYGDKVYEAYLKMDSPYIASAEDKRKCIQRGYPCSNRKAIACFERSGEISNRYRTS